MYRMNELIPMYRIEKILTRNNSKKTVIERSTLCFQSLRNFEMQLANPAMTLFYSETVLRSAKLPPRSGEDAFPQRRDSFRRHREVLPVTPSIDFGTPSSVCATPRDHCATPALASSYGQVAR